MTLKCETLWGNQSLQLVVPNEFYTLYQRWNLFWKKTAINIVSLLNKIFKFQFMQQELTSMDWEMDIEFTSMFGKNLKDNHD